MGDFFFLVKTLLITIAIVSLMQVRVGGLTVEKKVEVWAKSSAPIQVLREVSAGAFKALNRGYESAAGFIDEQWSGKKGVKKSGSAGSRADHENAAGESI